MGMFDSDDWDYFPPNGKWKKRIKSDRVYCRQKEEDGSLVYCTHCGKEGLNYFRFFQYCPHCGARMEDATNEREADNPDQR